MELFHFHKWELISTQPGYAYTKVLYRCKNKNCQKLRSEMIVGLWEIKKKDEAVKELYKLIRKS